jgi:hypothetical protein
VGRSRKAADGARADFVIEKLAKAHDLSRFDCGNDALSLWLRRFAWTNVQNDSARVYVAHQRDQVVVGYHALTAGSVSRAEAPASDEDLQPIQWGWW